jgi:DNA-binding beta-propeller fold protein YncE
LTGDFIYVSDFNLNTVFRLDVGLQTCQPLVAPGLLRRPNGLAVDAVGQLLVADTRNNRLVVFSPDGRLLSSLDSLGPSSPLDQPLDIAVMKAGFFAVLDLNGRVSIL